MEEYVLKYLEKIGVKNVDELSDKQVFDFFKYENNDNPIGLGSVTIESAMKFGGIKMEDIIKSMRKSLETNILFKCWYVTNESAFGGDYVPKKHGWILEP